MKFRLKKFRRLWLFRQSKRFRRLDFQIESSDRYQKVLGHQLELFGSLLSSMNEKQKIVFDRFYCVTRRLETLRARQYYKKGLTDVRRLIKFLIFKK